jgi:osmotically-inducible protein OsmY
MNRQLSIIIGAAAAIAAAVAVLLNRRRIADAAKRRVRAGAATDDVSLARKVETHIFRPHDAPKGDVSVDVEAGVVYLRGTADDTWRERLGREAREIPGVIGVKNLLHAAGTPTPPAPPRSTMLDQD